MANKTIDERVVYFMARLKAGAKHNDLANDYRLSLLEVARDQCHACAEALLDVPGDGNFKVDRDRVHAAVMNATIR